ncbi:MAG: Coenzyme F420 hydrogenase/dehydrogenase, beta subunit C-terminal domain [Clostridia bacterium]|nr:Coenzyme F420 hydrogenase/dehydrogenase, beta subunit C-terminal domain [Clostridia bacterium]
MKTEVCPQKDCVLCMACANVCPKGAIGLGADEYGYEKITVDTEKCIDCGLCTKVCNRRADVPRHTPVAGYAAQALDADSLKKSASGGAFQMLAEIVLSNGGVCYGCTFYKDSDGFVSKHIRVDSIENLHLILNTKYVPSMIGNVFQEAQNDLKSGKFVLFCGTPCQIQGFKAFLGKEYENLLTADLICHGIASLNWFNDYVRVTEEREKITITDYSFRDKSVSWGTNFSFRYYKKDDPKKQARVKHCPRESSSYTVHYLNTNILRENCYSCTLSNTHRVSDFTLGDFWGIEQEYAEFATNLNPRMVLRRGISCIMVNTEKAEGLIPLLNEKMILRPVTLESITSHNGNLREPSKYGRSRRNVLDAYKEFGYSSIEESYQSAVKKKLPVYKLKNFLKSRLPDRLRIFIYQTPALRKIIFH